MDLGAFAEVLIARESSVFLSNLTGLVIVNLGSSDGIQDAIVDELVDLAHADGGVRLES